MINRYILKIIFLSFVKAQIALPTFQAVHKPQSSSSSSSLYNFTSHTFTNCGATSTSGPTLANCKSSYDTSWEDNTNYFNVQTQGIQEWTVPKTGEYEFLVKGAAEGWSFGKGAVITVILVIPEILRLGFFRNKSFNIKM